MIAMQYSFTLPADYDMDIIDQRIREKGPALDGFPHLRFKAYLAARQQKGEVASAENLYAPFYLWDDPEGANMFLTHPGFKALARNFGWPVVETWIIWVSDVGEAMSKAQFASRDIQPIAAYSDLAERSRLAVGDAAMARQKGALATVIGFNPTSWTQVRFSLWQQQPIASDPQSQLYTVGHVSLP